MARSVAFRPALLAHGARGAPGSEGRGRAGEQRARRSQTYEVAVRPSSRWAPLEVGRHAGGNLHSSGQDPSDDPSAAFGLTGWRHRSSRGTPTSAPPKHELPGERGGRDVSGRRSILSEMKHKIEPLSIASISVWLERGVQGRQWQNYTTRALYSLLSVVYPGDNGSHRRFSRNRSVCDFIMFVFY